MAEPYLSQVEAFAFNYAPKGWLMCQGQTLPVNQYQALFALLGTTFGGNGTTTFQLPDLRSRLPLGMGQGAGLTNYIQGEIAGTELVTVATANMPAGAHTHTIGANNATSGSVPTPASNTLLSSGYAASATVTPVNIYSTTAPTLAMGTVSPVGGQPHTNIQPVLAINYCICISGLFPSRN
jgi:microcystin-dependent protein